MVTLGDMGQRRHGKGTSKGGRYAPYPPAENIITSTPMQLSGGSVSPISQKPKYQIHENAETIQARREYLETFEHDFLCSTRNMRCEQKGGHQFNVDGLCLFCEQTKQETSRLLVSTTAIIEAAEEYINERNRYSTEVDIMLSDGASYGSVQRFIERRNENLDRAKVLLQEAVRISHYTRDEETFAHERLETFQQVWGQG